MLRRARLSGEIVIARMAGQDVIGHRLTEAVELHAHADFISVGQALRLLLVDLVRLDELEGKGIVKRGAPVLDDEHLAVPREAFHHHFLHVIPRHFAVDGAVSEAAPAPESALNGAVPALIEAAHAIQRLHLKGKTPVPNHVGL